jgi:hypothetical protein
MNDNQQPSVTILVGRAWQEGSAEADGIHVLLVAPDEDSAVRATLEALAAEGYAEAELDQIGELAGPPDEEPHASAYQGALRGEVAIVTFEELR